MGNLIELKCRTTFLLFVEGWHTLSSSATAASWVHFEVSSHQLQCAVQPGPWTTMTGASMAVAVRGPEVENRFVGSVCVGPVKGNSFCSSGIALLDAVVVIIQAVSPSRPVHPHGDAGDGDAEVGVGQDGV